MTAAAPGAPMPGTRSVAAELEANRFAVTVEKHNAIMNSPGRDLADMTEAEFEDGLVRLKRAQARMKRILAEVLVEDVHYGREKDSSGNPIFKKDRLKKAGAEELRRLMKITIKDVQPCQVVADEKYLSVIVTCGAYDSYGRLLAVAQGACNTKEKRFKGRGGNWTYTDPREELHNCLAMSRKRAGSLLTCEVSGATGFFADGDAIDAEEDDDRPMTPWTDAEKKACGDAGAAKGMTRADYTALVGKTLGRNKVGTGDDAAKLLAAIKGWEKPGVTADADQDDEGTAREEG